MATKKASRRAERRRATRVDAKLSMRVEPGAMDGDTPQIVTESQNISGSGVYCRSDHYLAPLSKVALTIVLPSLPGRRAREEMVKCDGIVVRCEQPARRGEKHYELACMFSGLEADSKRRINEFVTWRNLQSLRAATAPKKAAKKKTVRRRTVASATAARPRRPAARTAARRRTVH